MPGAALHFRDPKVFWRGLAAGRSLHLILYKGQAASDETESKGNGRDFFAICGEDLTTGGDFTDDLASQVVFPRYWSFRLFRPISRSC